MPFVDIAGSRVHYVSGGNGPALMFVHGTGGDSGQWAEVESAVGDRFTVICPDLPGSGRTIDDGGPLTIAAIADQIAAIAAAAGVGPVTLIGHSLGAVAAAATAARHPELVDRLVMHAGWARSDARLKVLFGVWARLLAEDALLYGELVLSTALSPNYLARFDERGLRELTSGFASNLAPGTLRQIALDGEIDIAGDVASLQMPVLLLESAYDQIITADHTDVLAAAIPHAARRSLPAGHGATLEMFEAFLAEVIAFARC
jgi:pimeloyl-ACP methyl ester carboxylesterase